MNNLRKLRKSKGLTQTEIAQFIGITQNSYSYWENDKVKIDNASIVKLADFFGVSVDYLLGRESIITDDDRAKGWVDSDMVKVIPIEVEMLEVFREVGAKRGKEAQKALIAVAKNMCD